jgi:hypothetical protein
MRIFIISHRSSSVIGHQSLAVIGSRQSPVISHQRKQKECKYRKEHKESLCDLGDLFV